MFNARNALFNKSIPVSGSNNVGAWGRSPQPPEANWGSAVWEQSS